MKRYGKQVCSCIIFIILLTVILVGISDLLERKSSKNKYKMFYANADKIDVLFFGPSVVLYGIYPTELWSDYGIAAYNNANESERIATTYWVIKNSLDYCKPQLVVVDMTALNWGDEKTDKTLKDHNFFDSIPFSTNKISAIMDLFPKGKRAEYIWNFILYHSRWIEYGLQEVDEENCQMGAQMRLGVQYSEQPQIGDKAESRSISNSDDKIVYMDRIVRLCREENIDLLFTFMPYRGRQGDILLREFAEKYCQENSVDYLDLLEKGIVDYRIDYIDDIHLNPAGARKVTKYLGNYISTHYKIKDRRNNEEYAVWNDNYQKYVEYKNRILCNEKNLYNYVMLLEDEHLNVVYLTKKQSLVYEDKKIGLLLDYLDAKETNQITVQMLQKYILNDGTIEGNAKEGEYNAYWEMLETKCIPTDLNNELLFFVIDKEKQVIVDVASFTFTSSFQNRKL